MGNAIGTLISPILASNYIWNESIESAAAAGAELRYTLGEVLQGEEAAAVAHAARNRANIARNRAKVAKRVAERAMHMADPRRSPRFVRSDKVAVLKKEEQVAARKARDLDRLARIAEQAAINADHNFAVVDVVPAAGAPAPPAGPAAGAPAPPAVAGAAAGPAAGAPAPPAVAGAAAGPAAGAPAPPAVAGAGMMADEDDYNDCNGPELGRFLRDVNNQYNLRQDIRYLMEDQFRAVASRLICAAIAGESDDWIPDPVPVIGPGGADEADEEERDDNLRWYRAAYKACARGLGFYDVVKAADIPVIYTEQTPSGPLDVEAYLRDLIMTSYNAIPADWAGLVASKDVPAQAYINIIRLKQGIPVVAAPPGNSAADKDNTHNINKNIIVRYKANNVPGFPADAAANAAYMGVLKRKAAAVMLAMKTFEQRSYLNQQLDGAAARWHNREGLCRLIFAIAVPAVESVIGQIFLDPPAAGAPGAPIKWNDTRNEYLKRALAAVYVGRRVNCICKNLNRIINGAVVPPPADVPSLINALRNQLNNVFAADDDDEDEMPDDIVNLVAEDIRIHNDPEKILYGDETNNIREVLNPAPGAAGDPYNEAHYQYAIESANNVLNVGINGFSYYDTISPIINILDKINKVSERNIRPIDINRLLLEIDDLVYGLTQGVGAALHGSPMANLPANNDLVINTIIYKAGLNAYDSLLVEPLRYDLRSTLSRSMIALADAAVAAAVAQIAIIDDDEDDLIAAAQVIANAAAADAADARAAAAAADAGAGAQGIRINDFKRRLDRAAAGANLQNTIYYKLEEIIAILPGEQKELVRNVRRAISPVLKAIRQYFIDLGPALGAAAAMTNDGMDGLDPNPPFRLRPAGPQLLNYQLRAVQLAQNVAKRHISGSNFVSLIPNLPNMLNDLLEGAAAAFGRAAAESEYVCKLIREEISIQDSIHDFDKGGSVIYDSLKRVNNDYYSYRDTYYNHLQQGYEMLRWDPEFSMRFGNKTARNSFITNKAYLEDYYTRLAFHYYYHRSGTIHMKYAMPNRLPDNIFRPNDQNYEFLMRRNDFNIFCGALVEEPPPPVAFVVDGQKTLYKGTARIAKDEIHPGQSNIHTFINTNLYSPDNNFFVCLNAESAADAAPRPHRPFNSGAIVLSEYGRQESHYIHEAGNSVDQIPGLFDAKFQNITHYEGFPRIVDMLVGENCINNVEANALSKHYNSIGLLSGRMRTRYTSKDNPSFEGTDGALLTRRGLGDADGRFYKEITRGKSYKPHNNDIRAIYSQKRFGDQLQGLSCNKIIYYKHLGNIINYPAAAGGGGGVPPPPYLNLPTFREQSDLLMNVMNKTATVDNARSYGRSRRVQNAIDVGYDRMGFAHAVFHDINAIYEDGNNEVSYMFNSLDPLKNTDVDDYRHVVQAPPAGGGGGGPAAPVPGEPADAYGGGVPQALGVDPFFEYGIDPAAAALAAVAPAGYVGGSRKKKIKFRKELNIIKKIVQHGGLYPDNNSALHDNINIQLKLLSSTPFIFMLYQYHSFDNPIHRNRRIFHFKHAKAFHNVVKTVNYRWPQAPAAAGVPPDDADILRNKYFAVKQIIYRSMTDNNYDWVRTDKRENANFGPPIYHVNNNIFNRALSHIPINLRYINNSLIDYPYQVTAGFLIKIHRLPDGTISLNLFSTNYHNGYALQQRYGDENADASILFSDVQNDLLRLAPAAPAGNHPEGVLIREQTDKLNLYYDFSELGIPNIAAQYGGGKNDEYKEITTEDILIMFEIHVLTNPDTLEDFFETVYGDTEGIPYHYSSYIEFYKYIEKCIKQKIKLSTSIAYLYSEINKPDSNNFAYEVMFAYKKILLNILEDPNIDFEEKIDDKEVLVKLQKILEETEVDTHLAKIACRTLRGHNLIDYLYKSNVTPFSFYNMIKLNSTEKFSDKLHTIVTESKNEELQKLIQDAYLEDLKSIPPTTVDEKILDLNAKHLIAHGEIRAKSDENVEEVDEYEERMKKFYEEEYPGIYDSRKDKYNELISQITTVKAGIEVLEKISSENHDLSKIQIHALINEFYEYQDAHEVPSEISRLVESAVPALGPLMKLAKDGKVAGIAASEMLTLKAAAAEANENVNNSASQGLANTSAASTLSGTDQHNNSNNDSAIRIGVAVAGEAAMVGAEAEAGGGDERAIQGLPAAAHGGIRQINLVREEFMRSPLGAVLSASSSSAAGSSGGTITGIGGTPESDQLSMVADSRVSGNSTPKSQPQTVPHSILGSPNRINTWGRGGETTQPGSPRSAAAAPLGGSPTSQEQRKPGKHGSGLGHEILNRARGAAADIEEASKQGGTGRKTRRRKHGSKNKSKKARKNPKKISTRHLTRSTMSTRHRL